MDRSDFHFVSPVPRVSLGYPASNCGKTISAERNFDDLHVLDNGRTAHRMLKKSVQQGRRRVETGGVPSVGYVEDFDEPRTPLADFFSILLEESALLEKVLVYNGGGFGGKLSPFLQQTFDVFPDQV
jgi:hypothetical protein